MPRFKLSDVSEVSRILGAYGSIAVGSSGGGVQFKVTPMPGYTIEVHLSEGEMLMTAIDTEKNKDFLHYLDASTTWSLDSIDTSDEKSLAIVLDDWYQKTAKAAKEKTLSYSDFKTLESAIAAFNLTITNGYHLFKSIRPIEPSNWLLEYLGKTIDLATSISTEKARSELIVTPILLEIRDRYEVGYFSGTTFNVDDSRSLTGVCDFLLTASANQIVIDVPVVAIVEAKDNDIRSGLGQCAAEMFAAGVFNNDTRYVWGCVTTGSLWRFLRLSHGSELEVDLSEYSISQLPEILGILSQPFTKKP